jgi:hypothetical protein
MQYYATLSTLKQKSHPKNRVLQKKNHCQRRNQNKNHCQQEKKVTKKESNKKRK